jgi:hypothetical protein
MPIWLPRSLTRCSHQENTRACQVTIGYVDLVLRKFSAKQSKNGLRLLKGRFGMTCLCRRLRGTGSIAWSVVKLAEKTAEKRLSKRHLRLRRET